MNFRSVQHSKLPVLLALSLVLTMLFSACKKEQAYIPDNKPPYYNEVSTVLVENYVNRIFIDLLGREPLDTEMEAEVQNLRNDSLSEAARITLINKLMTDETPVDGDISYKHAYYQRLYDLSKVKLLEGAADGEVYEEIGMAQNAYVVDSLNGDSVGMDINRLKMDRLWHVLDAKDDYREGIIEISEMHAFMLHNAVYDKINMNTFNFINASFDDLFSRYPTQEEFTVSFDMIEYNLSRKLFEQPGQNKDDYVYILTHSREYYEGVIRWMYYTLLAREATTLEVQDAMETFYTDHDLQQLQSSIMVTDEYANFD